MNYDAFRLPSVGCTVVFGGEQADRDRFAEVFLAAHPDFQLQILPALANYKTGFLRKKKTLKEVLSQGGNQDLPSQLERQGKELGIQGLLPRGPETLSFGQKRLWSMAREAILGRGSFLLQDNGDERSVQEAARFLCWLQQYTKQPRVLWLTGLSPEQFSDYLFSGMPGDFSCNRFLAADLAYCTVLSRSRALFRLKDGQLQEETDSLASALRAKKEQETAVALQEALRLESLGQYASAAEILEALVQQKNGKAMYHAARLYYTQRCGQWEYRWQLERSHHLCNLAVQEFRLPEASVLMGDMALEHLEKAAADYRADNNGLHKRVLFDTVRSAAGCYFTAANRGSMEGCYKACRLALRFTLSESWSDGEETYRLDKDAALPYLKRLLAAQDNGDPDAKRWLLELQLQDADTFLSARREYEEARLSAE